MLNIHCIIYRLLCSLSIVRMRKWRSAQSIDCADWQNAHNNGSALHSLNYMGFSIRSYYLCQGGYVFAFVCLSVSRITQKAIKSWCNFVGGVENVKSEQDSKAFQKDLDKLAAWGKTWTMKFRPDKCEVISITRKRKPAQYPYVLNGHQLLDRGSCMRFADKNLLVKSWRIFWRGQDVSLAKKHLILVLMPVMALIEEF